MGQEPNIELTSADAPRRTAEPGAPGRWVNERPGAITSPDQQPWGGTFGRPGPDTGWARRLITRADFDRSHRVKETESVLAALVGARASHYGRAPVPQDVEVGLTLLGLRSAGLPEETVESLRSRREHALDHAAHEHSKGAGLLDEIPLAHLAATPEELLALLA